MKTLNQKIEFLNWNNRFDSILTNDLSKKDIDIICLNEKGKKLFNVLCNDLKKLNDFSPNITRTFFKTHSAKNKPYFNCLGHFNEEFNINKIINFKTGYCNPVYYYENLKLQDYINLIH